MADDVSIKFSADISDLQKGMEQASSAVRGTTDALKSGATQVTSSFASLAQAYASSISQKLQAIKDAGDTALAIARVTDRGEFDIAMNGVKQQIALVKEQAQTSQMSHQEELAALLQLEDRRAAIELEHFQIVKSTYAEGTVAYANAQRQITELASQSALRRQEIERSVNQQIYAEYRRSFEQIGSSVSSSIMGMIKGQETLRQAAQSVALSIIQSFIQARIRMVADWLAGQATKVTATHVAEAAQTAATTAGVAARSSAEQSGAATSLAISFAQILKSITASASETFAGIFGFLSPVMGPAAAGPAAAGEATVLAAGAALPSFDAGAWSLPSDMIARVHQGEMIVPAGPAAALRGALSGAGSPSVQVHHATHFNVQALDSKDVKKWFRSNGKTILSTINESVRNGAHLGLSKLNSPV